MSFQLTFTDYELALPLIFDDEFQEMLIRVLGIDDESERGREKRRQFSSRIANAIVEELRKEPPSERQVQYAVGIARRLKLELPPDVLQNKGSMAKFLDAHAEAYKRCRVWKGQQQ